MRMSLQNYQQQLTLLAQQKAKLPSVQSRFDAKESQNYWALLTDFCRPANTLGPIGTASRDAAIQKIWPDEPILAGILYTQQARLAAMHWTITGPEADAHQYADMFQNLGYGAGWDTETKKWSQDYLCYSRGALWEKGRLGQEGPVVGLAYMDMARCALTGKPDFPIQYTKSDGRYVDLRREDVIHRCSMPSGREERFGSGICLVDRAMRAIQLLMALHKYEEDTLDDMPPDGIASISGMDEASVEKAMGLWKDKKDSRDLTFRRILWMVGNPLSTQPLKIEFIPFNELPKDFNRREVIETYVKTVALSAGEDPNEFWLFVHTGATKGIGTLLHEKGQGKGVMEMASVLERAFNSEVLPEGLAFGFDYRDRTAQKMELQRKQAAIENVINLWRPPFGGTRGLIPDAVAVEMLVIEQVLTPKQAALIAEGLSVPSRVTDTQVMTDTEGMEQNAVSTDGARVDSKALFDMVREEQGKMHKELHELREEMQDLGETKQ